MTTATTTPVLRPWYKEPWPWLLAAGPAIVVVAASYTAYLALSTRDGLVTEDYYKQGLAVSEVLAQNDHARALGLEAHMSLIQGGVKVGLRTRAGVEFRAPATMRFTLSHPTRAGLDQTEILKREGNYYVGSLHLPNSGHWLVLMEDEAKTWRLMASVMLPSSDEIVIGGEDSADIRN